MESTRKPGPAESPSDTRQPLDLKPFLVKYLRPGNRLSVAYSGGLDSTALLHGLAQLRSEMALDLEAVHVHHGLSPHADGWATHCADFCAALDVPLRIGHVHVSQSSGQGLEAAARQARYEAFSNMGVTHLALAHHLDDQMETFFLRLMRGAGPRGLAGMKPASDRQGMLLLRPLLNVGRQHLAHYANDHGLAHVDDESNLDRTLARNHVRHELLPILAARYASYRTIVSREMRLQEEASDLLDQLAAGDLARAGSGPRLDLNALSGLDPARVRNLLRYWLRLHSGSVPGADALHALWVQIVSAGTDAGVAWHHAGWWVRRYRHTLWLLQEDAPPQVSRFQLRWQGGGRLTWPLGGQIIVTPTWGGGISQARLATGTPTFRQRQGGELFRLAENRPLRSLKKCLQEAAIPPWHRVRMPILFHDGQPVWVPGLGVDARFQAAGEESGWLISWQ